MRVELHPDHPDFDRKTGDERVYQGRTYKFGMNQFSCYWRSGPKDGTITCSKDYPTGSPAPYIGGEALVRTFEQAADRERNGARREYDKAKALVARYESAE